MSVTGGPANLTSVQQPEPAKLPIMLSSARPSVTAGGALRVLRATRAVQPAGPPGRACTGARAGGRRLVCGLPSQHAQGGGGEVRGRLGRQA